ncbi:MlaD family protein [Antrihabitans stalactiti]|uniref:MCE family protein n=1 Tax=Antrihabitans stalactiti TaxID=2584121 RepID=A0A848KDP0_9NOCA|nr:MlaD family protein [Antrihabitans stalactiti]NMN94280.1 MCE family protein [Antrihabitans stalactiti]
MQSMKPQRPRRRFGTNKPIPNAAETKRRELRMGIVGAALVAALLAAAGLFYVLPLGKSTYIAHMSEAGAIKAGDNVRIAGIPVGEVKSVELDSDTVTMKFTVDDDVFIGDATTLDIKMLTAAGGHYLAVTPSGTKPLGSKPIPADHVHLPYSLMRAFQDAATPIAEVDGNTFRQNLASLEASLTTSPDGLREIGRAMDSFVDVLDRQNKDISDTLALADEYLTMVNSTKSLVGDLIRKISSLETTMEDKREEIRSSLALIARLLSRIAALEPSYQQTLRPLVEKFGEAIPELQRLGERLDGVLANVAGIGRSLQAMITPQGVVAVDQSAATVELPQLCIPLPGRAC